MNHHRRLFSRPLISLFTAVTLTFLYTLPVSADFSNLRSYYLDPGPNIVSSPPAPGRVLQATDTAGTVDIISGYIEKFPNPDVPSASQYYIGVEGQGLVEIGPQQIPPGLNIDQLIGQYVALGDIEGETLIAPVPPPTDEALVKAAASAAEDEPDTPDLPPPGTTKGFLHQFELFGEGIVDGTLNLVSPGNASERAYKRAAERSSEAHHLLKQEDPAVSKAIARVKTAMEDIFTSEPDDDQARDLESRLAGLQTTFEKDQAELPESTQEAFIDLRSALAIGVDAAADNLDRPPITPGVVQGLRSLQTIGVIQREQVAQIYNHTTRKQVRATLEDFVDNGYLTPADIKGALDESAAALYPNQVRQIIELDKLQSLGQLEAVKPDDAMLARLQTFSSTFIPGVTPVPPDLLPFWVASVNLDRIQQTIRPDFIPDDVLKSLENLRPGNFAKFKELEHRFKPSPQDIVALEQYKAQLREQFPDAANIDDYLPPNFRRLASFRDRFGIKDPEGWKRPAGLAGPLPFAGPGGLRDPSAIDDYCAQNGDECRNFAAPSGYALTPAVGVNFGPEDRQGPPIFPGYGGFRAPVVTYDIQPLAPTQYLGRNGCTNPIDCLRSFQELPPEERADNFFVYQAPPPGAPARPENYDQMTPEERRDFWDDAIERGDKIPPPGSNFGPVDAEGRPLPGPGAAFNPNGSPNYPVYGPASGPYPGPAGFPDNQPAPYYNPNGAGSYNPNPNYSPSPNQYYDPYNSSGGSDPYYPAYSQPQNQYDSGGSGNYTPPPPDNSGTYYPPPPGDSGSAPPPPDSGGDPAPPPDDGGGGGEPPPPDSGGDPAPPPDDGGGGDEPPPPDSGGDPAPPPDDGGGGGEPPPPDDGGGAPPPPPPGG